MSEEPPSKLRKIESYLVKKVNVVPILDPKITCESVISTSFYALRLENKKSIGQIIKHLKELPESLQHLKRVDKDGSVLIAECEETAREIVSELNNDNVRLENLKKVEVPAIKPSTRRQFEFAKHLWPTGFHPNHELEEILNGSFLTETLQEYVGRWIQKAIKLGEGCISVQNDTLLSSGCSSSHPLGHSVMEMVGNLSKRTGSDYLGTGCDVFLVNEPCAMCSMALVHFRIKRLYYVRNSRNGVLKKDGWQLHLEPSINHHYEVFRVEVTCIPIADDKTCFPIADVDSSSCLCTNSNLTNLTGADILVWETSTPSKGGTSRLAKSVVPNNKRVKSSQLLKETSLSHKTYTLLQLPLHRTSTKSDCFDQKIK